MINLLNRPNKHNSTGRKNHFNQHNILFYEYVKKLVAVYVKCNMAAEVCRVLSSALRRIHSIERKLAC